MIKILINYFKNSIHVVFGRVVSGQPVVMQIEELGVDKNSRPLQDAKVVKCGELILKSKIKRMFIDFCFNCTCNIK